MLYVPKIESPKINMAIHTLRKRSDIDVPVVETVASSLLHACHTDVLWDYEYRFLFGYFCRRVSQSSHGCHPTWVVVHSVPRGLSPSQLYGEVLSVLCLLLDALPRIVGLVTRRSTRVRASVWLLG